MAVALASCPGEPGGREHRRWWSRSATLNEVEGAGRFAVSGCAPAGWEADVGELSVVKVGTTSKANAAHTVSFVGWWGGHIMSDLKNLSVSEILR